MHEETNEDEKDKLELGEKILVTIISNTTVYQVSPESYIWS